MIIFSFKLFTNIYNYHYYLILLSFDIKRSYLLQVANNISATKKMFAVIINLQPQQKLCGAC